MSNQSQWSPFLCNLLNLHQMFLPCGFHLWTTKTSDPLNPLQCLVHILNGFNSLTMTNIGCSKLLIETRRTILLGKQYCTLNGPNHLFLNLHRFIFFPFMKTIRHNVQIRTSFQNFFVDSTKNYSISWLPHCSELPIYFLVFFLVL